MTVSALFDIDPGTGTFGSSGVAQDVDAAGATVNCRVSDTTNVSSVTWSIFGTHGAAAPSITNSTATTCSFDVPAGSSQAYGIQCVVRDAFGNTDTRKSAVYVRGLANTRPGFSGETFERDSSYGMAPDINRMFAGHYGANHVGGGKIALSGGAGATNVDGFTHSATGDAVMVARISCHAVDTGTPDTAMYEILQKFRITAGGSPVASGTSLIVNSETDSTWAVAATAFGAEIRLQLTPDATNDTTFLWSWAISVLEAEAA